EASILDLGVAQGVLKRSGAWYTYGDERLGQGREAAKETLRTNPDMSIQIETEVREKLGMVKSAAESAAESKAAQPGADTIDPAKDAQAPKASDG
ncbi:MAG: DNA recombination/repair protein RecA, partial [Coriobacteriia bacterium]|nr:DNA recombination/repair protein RecA [Coriobacteriia bacterium]